MTHTLRAKAEELRREIEREALEVGRILLREGRPMLAKDVGRKLVPMRDARRAGAALIRCSEAVPLKKRAGHPARWGHRLWLPTLAATAAPSEAERATN